MLMLQSACGLLVFLLVAWLISEKRSAVSLRVVFVGLAIQLLLGTLVLKVPASEAFFFTLNRVVLALEESLQAGTSFVFGYLGGGPAPFEESVPSRGYIFAFRALPLLLFLSALSSLLFYWKVLPVVVSGLSRLLQKSLRLGGAESLGVGANVFMGMVEAPLFVRPYLEKMTRSELFTVMTCGMSTIAGTVMVLYASILSGLIPNALGHILAASLMNAPAAVVVSKLMIPETKELTGGRLVEPEPARNSMDALTQGTLQGVQFLINIIAMLIVMVALVHLINLLLALLPFPGDSPLSLQGGLGFIMAPVVWLVGVPWVEAHAAGQLMATKTIVNELVAFVELSRLPEGTLSARGQLLLTYAMCGFANPGSLGIMIGGLGSMVPSRRAEIIQLGFRSILAGTLATCLTGAWIGILSVGA